MAHNAPLDPSAFFLEGGPVGVMLIHGFPGSTTDVRLLGTFLHKRGLTVSAPLLPGHGTQPADLNRVRWQDWTACAEETLAQLTNRCEIVFVGGLSMGSLVTLHVSAHHPELAGIALYSPAIAIRNWLIHLTPLVKYFIPFWPAGESDGVDAEAARRLWTYDVRPTHGAHEVYRLMKAARRLLPGVVVPAIIFHSILDQEIAPHSAQMAYERIGSADKELVTLHNSGHNILVDAEWEVVAERTYRFIERHR
jgi:carboxylesterase